MVADAGFGYTSPSIGGSLSRAGAIGVFGRRLLVVAITRTASLHAFDPSQIAAGKLSGKQVVALEKASPAQVIASALGETPVLFRMSIGLGSKPIVWMNDNGLWIMCKMSGPD